MRRAIVLVCVGLVGIAGCAFDWSFPADGTGGDAGPDARGDGANDGSAVRKDGSAADAIAPPAACKDGSGCVSGSYCVFEPHDCGKGGGTGLGQCRPAITACPGPATSQVCGCNGVLYPNVCAASGAGQDIGGRCTPPAGTFACGDTFCTDKKEFCLVQKGVSACTDLKACAAADCTCPAVTGVGCAGATCNDKTQGQVTLTCP